MLNTSYQKQGECAVCQEWPCSMVKAYG